MRIAGCANVLDPHEIDLIHSAMLRIVSEVGMRIENATILSRLADIGGGIDEPAQVVRLAPDVVEQFIADSDVVDWAAIEPRVTASAGIFLGRYLDPETNEHLPWTAERVLTYARVADGLEHVGEASMLGCPIPGVANEIHPLYQRYFCWKHGIRSGGSLWDIRLCPYIWEMCETAAAGAGGTPQDHFEGAVYLSTTLLLPQAEAEQFVYFAERGLHVGVSHMTSAGGSAPVTLAGAVALHLAEAIFINFIQRAFYGTRALRLHCSIAPLDMRSLMYAYGRPERQIANVIMAGMAKHYGASYSGHSGHSDAKVPGPEAGAQKALTSIPTLMAGGSVNISAGLLSVDEVFSPIQMIVDNEYLAALKRLARGCEISEETLAVDLIEQVGPGRLFMDTDHTAAHFRSEVWQPALWSREMFDAWLPAGARTDVDRALDIYHDILREPEPPIRISDETHAALRRIMDRALQDLRR